MASETELEVGRELDALVAEKVLDRVVCRTEDDIPDGWQLDDRQSLPGYCDGTFVYTLPHYSRDIAAAWPVASKLGIAIIPVDGGFLAGCFNDTFAPTYISDEDGVIDGRMDQYAKAETAPLAICRAALAAVQSGHRGQRVEGARLDSI